MRKMVIFMLFFFIVIDILNAQSKGTLNYKLTTNDRILGERKIQTLIVYFNKSNSIELIIKPRSITNDKKQDELNVIKTIITKRPYFVYKDFSSKKLVLSEYIAAKKYLINDTLNNFKWKVSREKDKILNFNCKKATTLFRGRYYEAWYTEDVPIQNGPWKFCDLPGLIVKIRDLRSDFVYELIGIDLKNKFDNKIISIPAVYNNDKAVSYREFRILYNKKLEDNLKLSRQEQITPDGTTGTMSISLPEKQEKF